MEAVNRTYVRVEALVDELTRCGLRHAVTSPGSRNAPLLLSLAAEPRVRCLSVLDERSAGYAALGIAKATGRPVVVTCTSGTAAANLLPAVAEAREARVPLLVLTADRPPELRDVGAGQAIDQVRLYGSQVKWYVEVDGPEDAREAAAHLRSLACRAWATACEGRPGPVHLNVPLREPLAPAPEPVDAAPWAGRPDGRPWVEVDAPDPRPAPATVEGLGGELAGVRRGAIVCGPARPGMGGAVGRLAARLGWPVLAEPTSGVRCGAHDRSAVVSHYDVLLRDEAWAAAHAPERVLRLGDTPTSKPLRAWLARSPQVVVDPEAAWHEPTRQAERIVRASPAPLCEALAAAAAQNADPAWLRSWRDADARVPPALDAAPDPFEPKAFAALAPALRDGDLVWLASSMPVREVEALFPSVAADVLFQANRGANGIDGTASSAMGAAWATGRRTFLLIGDLSLLYDLGGLVAARRQRVPLTVVCVNDDGGGIFDFLPVARHADPAAYREHVVTPSGVPMADVAALAGLPHRRATTPEEVRAAVAEPGLVEVRTERERSPRLHDELYERVAAAR